MFERGAPWGVSRAGMFLRHGAAARITTVTCLAEALPSRQSRIGAMKILVPRPSGRGQEEVEALAIVPQGGTPASGGHRVAAWGAMTSLNSSRLEKSQSRQLAMASGRMLRQAAFLAYRGALPVTSMGQTPHVC